MRVLVTGSAGMLGTALIPTLAVAGHEVHATDLRLDETHPWGLDGPFLGGLDVRSPSDIGRCLRVVRPDIVVHLAAETDVDLCEAREEHAYETNALGTKYVALACRQAGIELAYVSTAGVFDGEKPAPYTEDDPAHPINAYGRSKLAGERYVEAILDRFYIVRAGWMVGGGRKDHKFVARILAQLAFGTRVLHAVGDKLGTPTYVPDFARCFTDLIGTRRYGLYHMACLGRGTRYDVAKRILQVLGRTDVELREVGSDFFREAFPAPRPRSEMMRNLQLDLQGWNTMRQWEESLDDYLRTSFPQFLRANAIARGAD